MSYIGYYGEIFFICSKSYLLSPNRIEREGGSRWNDTELIGRKPASSFEGPALEKIKLEIILDAMHGVDPESELKRLREIRDKGEVYPFVLNDVPLTQNYWRLDSLQEKETFFDGEGNLIHCKAEMQLTEYDATNTVEANYNLLQRIFGEILK